MDILDAEEERGQGIRTDVIIGGRMAYNRAQPAGTAEVYHETSYWLLVYCLRDADHVVPSS